MTYFERVSKYTPTRFWINNVTRNQARMAIKAGAISCTQNPAYLSKVIGSSDDGQYLDGILAEILRKDTSGDVDTIVSELQRQAIAGICKCFEDVYDSGDGSIGLVSIQADPFKETMAEILDNAEKILSIARNPIIKIPATKAGIEAMRNLFENRIPVLATEVMSIDQVIDVCKLYENVTAGMRNPAPFIIAHINGIFDEHIAEYVEKNNVDIEKDYYRQGALLLARKIHGYFHDNGWNNIGYVAGGARNLNHFTDWVGVNGSVTINWSKTADVLIEKDMPVIDVFNAPSSYAVTDKLLAKVPEFRIAYTPGSLATEEYEDFGPVVRFRNQFEAGWNKAREYVKNRMD